MQKIPTMFLRDEKHRVIDTPNPECEWVFLPEGDATVKWDGTAVLISGGKMLKRHRVREGKKAPEGWIHWSAIMPGGEGEGGPRITEGHGWIPVGDGPEDRAYVQAIEFWLETEGPEKEGDGTYELCGPNVQGNPHGFTKNLLIKHGNQVVAHVPLTFEGMRDYMELFQHEGLVYHHPDGRMAKIKRRDFGHPWPRKPDGDSRN